MSRSNLLLADDSVTIQKVVNLTFSGEGVEVVSVSDGNSAIDVLREDLPDLVMADVNLPGVNGYEICERVKSMDTEREIPVILLVGSFEPFDEEEAQRVGADGHLTKPFESIAALVDLVNGFLAGSETEEQQRFDDTVEYPPDHEMVVSASSIPFAGGFEDETIEAEQVSARSSEHSDKEEPEEDKFEPVGGLETFSDSYEPEAEAESDESELDEPARAEFDQDPGSSDQTASPEEQPSYYYSDSPADTASEQDYEDGQESASEDHLEGSGSEFGSWEQPVPASEDESEPAVYEEIGSEPDAEEQEESPYSGVYYREETYREASYFESRTEQDVESGSSEPIPLGPGDEDENATVDLGSVTVELDESELLELPVEQSEQDEESVGAEVFTGTEEEFQQTIRDGSFEGEAAGRSAGLTSEIPEELVNEIARRVVERLSEKAVREIAWEVVPEMAELIIRKMTEQKLNE